MQVLGIETSCDETGIAIYDAEAGLLAHNLNVDETVVPCQALKFGLDNVIRTPLSCLPRIAHPKF